MITVTIPNDDEIID